MTTGRGVAAPDRELVESRAAGDPDWLKERRLHALEVYQALPMPTMKLEEWRYTDVALLRLDEVTPAEPGPRAVPQAARTLLADRAASARVIQVGPATAEIELDEALRRQGVVLMDLAEAARQHPELVARYLGAELPPESGKFEALNFALWTSGIFLYVPKNVHLEQPVRVVRWLDEEGAAVFPRTLIVAEAGAHLAYVEEFSSPDFDAPTLSCGAVEVYAHDGAHVQYVAMQRWGRGVRHFSSQRTIAQRDADLDTLVVNLGATVARVDLKASLEGPGARSDMLGLYFGREDQHFDHNTRQDHAVPHATSDLLYKGALTDRARVVFRGLIRVYPNAQRTDAYQTNRNLILSRQAEAVSLPNLEIAADDVRCSHAATVGQLDEEEMFYIMTRGISRQEAERLVVFGFFGEVLDRLPLPGVVEELRHAIAERISG
jgi:Fe-S cluster assembly protein SufD